MLRVRNLLIALLALTPLAAFADDLPPPHDVWTGKGQLGIVSTQGNTEARTANAALDMALLTDHWQHSLHLEGLYAKTAEVTSAERYAALWQSNYDITSNFYTFGALRYSRDLFSGFNVQESASAGLGYKLFDSKDTKLSIQAGPGFRRDRPQELDDNSAGQVIGRAVAPWQHSGILSAALSYSQVLTGTTTLADTLLVESGGGDTMYNNQISLAVKVSSRLALSVAYAIVDNTAPPPGLRKTDTNETVNLVYSF